MIQVRNSEQNLKSGEKAVKQETSLLAPRIDSTSTEEALETSYQEIAIDEEQLEDISEVHEDITTEDDLSEQYQVDEPLEEKPVPKKPKTHAMIGIPDSIICTFYQLEHYSEKGQNVTTLNVTRLHQERPRQGTYTFNSSWISHSHLDTIYKCKYHGCIKAFANAEFLLKHMISSHLCLVCMDIVENYKDLNKHMKENHQSIACPICDKPCGSTTHYRQHLKKQHRLQLPAHIGILSNL